VPDLNDNVEDAKKTAKWIVDNIGDSVPLHFVGYHPAYLYNKPRTQLKTLLNARRIAKNEGIKYCYLGNVYRDDVSNTLCSGCGNVLIQRFGLTVKNIGLNTENKCVNCGAVSPIVGGVNVPKVDLKPKGVKFEKEYVFEWNSEQNSLHIIQNSNDVIYLKVIRASNENVEYYELNSGIERLILSKSSANEKFITIITQKIGDVYIVPVLDRAHYPVLNESKNSEKYIN